MPKKILIIILFFAVVPLELYANESASDKAHKLYEEALILGRAEDIKGAVIKLKAAAELEPNSAATHHELSWCYRMLGQGADAVEEMKKAVLLEPRNYAHHLDLGHLYIEQNNWQGAIEQLNILWDLDFENAKILEADIVTFKWQNLELGAVEKDGSRQASLNSEKMVGLEKLAYEAFSEGVKNFQNNLIEWAEKKVKEAISLDRKSIYVLFLARLYANQQFYKKSAETLESFLKDYPDDPQVLHMLGGAYFALGEHKKAVATWERIKDIDEIIYLTREKWIKEMKIQ